MNILFLDDCDDRALWARAHLASNLIHVRTAQEAIETLSSHSWERVYLDQDLDGKSWENWRGPNTGTAVVRWIMENRPTIKKIIVHTSNEIIGGRMVANLKRVGYLAEYIPFGALKETV